MAVVYEQGNYQLVGVDFNNPTFIMVGGMSIDDIKIKYNWFLNAEVKDAVIGEDDNGLVWYKGDWIGGTWENGTWYSGIFHDGRWKDGNWYSYEINEDEMMIGKLSIERVNINKSQFLSGTWEGGTFNYGIFGTTQISGVTEIPYEVTLDFILQYNKDFDVSGFTFTSGETYYYISGQTIEDITGGTSIQYNTVYINSPIFEGGEFIDGWMNAAKIKDGNFNNGYLNNSCWYGGNFYNGYFLGDVWYDGNFLGGDFSNGIWKNGNLTSYQNNVIARFGCDYKSTGATWNSGATWENGVFMNGEFHSHLKLLEGATYPSDDNSIVHWLNGTWENGTWYGGTFHNGNWITGTFYNGIILNIIWNKGHFENGFWVNGQMIEGTVSGGIFVNIIAENVKFGYDLD